MLLNENVLEHLLIVQDKRILISYKGPVTPVIMAEISRDIQDKFAEKPKVSRKIFSVFIELAQNILYYSAEKIRYAGRVESVGILQIQEMEGYFIFSCGNTIHKSKVFDLINNCKTINSLDKEELRKLRRYMRKQPQSDNSRGAGIGLVQVAILSNNPLELQVHEVDDELSFFTLSVNINK